MLTESGYLMMNFTKWLLEQFSIFPTDMELLLFSGAFSAICLCVLLAIVYFVKKIKQNT